MVRLKEKFIRISSVLPKFQFHYGTIKSRKKRICLDISRIYFNSTMVRLKAEDARCIARYTVKFQFHYGTIKRLIRPFNTRSLSKFQFHYGTIKSHSTI